METTTVVDVPLGDRSYAVEIGPGVRANLPDVIARIDVGKVCVVTSRPPSEVPDPGVPHEIVQVPDGEKHKTVATVERICVAFAEYGLTRLDGVVSVGGGTVTDMVGLAAALFHRGLPVVHLPTTLLAQVDASVGGKTAVNLRHGKNLVGVYWQPRSVLCDTDYLRSLPDREWTNGYGEIARCHFIGAGDLRGLPIEEQIAASVRLKASIVTADERDDGLRHLLNYGHTLGHALETATDFRLRHGEAVAIGTVFAGRLAHALGRIDEARATEHGEVVAHYGLPAELPSDVDTKRLITLMRHDKKATRGLTFVLDGPAGPDLVTAVSEEIVADVLAAMPRG